MTVIEQQTVSHRVRHLRYCLLVCLAVLVVGSLVGLLAAGTDGLFGVAAGVALVVFSYVASTLAIAWADSINPRMVLPVGIGMYIMKFTFFGGLFVLIEDAAWPGSIPMAMGIVAAVIAWTAVQIWWTVRFTNREL